MTTPLISGLHHVAIICSDVERSRRFYEGTLGLELIAATYRRERDSWKVDLRLPDGAQLELFSFPGAPARPSYPEARGLRHLALAVTDLEAAIATLNTRGAATEPVRTDEFTGSRFTFLADPDGLPIELYEVGVNK
ncbi:MAG: VOC family protein [Phycisphaerales bacterium]|nr:VOC family protein [Phycisphaerales bacterium]